MSPVALELDTKVAYQLREGLDLGFESYDEVGPLRSLGRLSTLGQTVYAVVDADVGKVALNAGVGRGLTGASDRWILKLIVGLQY